MRLTRRGFLKATLALAGAAPLLGQAARRTEARAFPIYIGVFADSEILGPGRDEAGRSTGDRLGEICDDAAALDMACLVGCGDLIVESADAFERFVSITEAPGRPVPIQYVFGNHDRWDGYQTLPILQHYGLDLRYRYLDLPRNLRLIFLATEIGPGTANSHITKAQAAWLTGAVGTSRACIAFAHHPRYNTIASSLSPNIYLAESGGHRAEVQAALNKCAALFSGHVQHAHDYHRRRSIETQQRMVRKVWYFGLQSVRPSSAHLGHGRRELDRTCAHHEYRVIQVDKNGIGERRRNFRTREWVDPVVEIF